jgi:HEAT repeat protein
MLMECDPHEVALMLSAAIKAAVGRGREDGLPRLLRLHSAAQPEATRAAVVEVLARCKRPDTLAAALATLWHPQDVAHARRLLSHDEWPVRVAAARALGRLGSAQDVDRLCVALGDRNWWVRYRAAQALCALPGLDEQVLRGLPGRLADRFAGDMLRQVLAEKAAA